MDRRDRSPIGAAARQLTASEAIVAPSSDDTFPGILHPPGTDTFPAAPPHTVPADTPNRWTAGVGRWWRGIFSRNAYARGPDTVRAGRSSHRFFQHLIDPAEKGADDAPPPGDAGK
ncbi:MAG TPA: hypothetical protein VFJ82_04140 [Longimicrobium sp.]|nr:hypothetical protein [Longimicrobium sp.]